jgi:hypothetical protein
LPQRAVPSPRLLTLLPWPRRSFASFSSFTSEKMRIARDLKTYTNGLHLTALSKRMKKSCRMSSGSSSEDKSLSCPPTTVRTHPLLCCVFRMGPPPNYIMLLGASAAAIVGAATIAWRMLPRKKVAKLMYQSVRLRAQPIPGGRHAPACTCMRCTETLWG